MREVNPWEVEKMIYNLEITLAEMEERALLKGRAEGRAEGESFGKAVGKVEAKQDAICRYLKKRFGDASLELQRRINGVNNLEVLDSIMEELFVTNTLEEAKAVIRGAMERFSVN